MIISVVDPISRIGYWPYQRRVLPFLQQHHILKYFEALEEK